MSLVAGDYTRGSPWCLRLCSSLSPSPGLCVRHDWCTTACLRPYLPYDLTNTPTPIASSFAALTSCAPPLCCRRHLTCGSYRKVYSRAAHLCSYSDPLCICFPKV